MSNKLIIHLIGCGFGESIILCLPNGKVGIVDCCSPTLKANTSAEKLQANPTLRFLRNNLHVEKLAFLAFTHPHEDHGRGMSHILESYKDSIDQIWIFDGYQDIALDRYFGALLEGNRRLPIEKLLNEPPGTFSRELMAIRKLVLEQIKNKNQNQDNFQKLSGRKQIEITDEPVVFHFLGPGEGFTQLYIENLHKNLQNLVDQDGKIVNKSWNPAKVNHNLASPAILIEFGKTRIILGGDMEKDGWNDVLSYFISSQTSLNCHFVKVSHHRSETGYIEGLYEKFGEQGLPIGVLTTFNRHSYPLPQKNRPPAIPPRFQCEGCGGQGLRCASRPSRPGPLLRW